MPFSGRVMLLPLAVTIIQLLCFRTATSDLFVGGVKGSYSLLQGDPSLCSASIKVACPRQTDGEPWHLLGEDFIVSGKPCSGGKILLIEAGLPNSTMLRRSPKPARLLTGRVTSAVSCPGRSSLFSVGSYFAFFNRTQIPITAEEVTSLLPDNRYLYAQAKAGTECIYIGPEAGKSLCPPMERGTMFLKPTSTPRESPTEADSSALWVWLGPVLGALATVTAAVITVFMTGCLSKKFANFSSCNSN